jgi:glutathione S-transferase
MNSTIKYSNFVLYSYFRSSCSWRVRIVLNLKNIKYEVKPIHLVKAENKTDTFEKINPFKKLPVLEFNEGDNIVRLPESNAICEFLEEAFSDVKLLPDDLIA